MRKNHGPVLQQLRSHRRHGVRAGGRRGASGGKRSRRQKSGGTLPPEVASAAGFRMDQRAPLADPAELEHYDAIIFGTPTRFGNMAAQMRNSSIDRGTVDARRAGGQDRQRLLSTASQHGGQETTITSFQTTLLHHGMIVVGLPYTFKDLSTMREVTGGTPYGASCVTGAGNELRMPSALELSMCRFQGGHVADITRRYEHAPPL